MTRVIAGRNAAVRHLRSIEDWQLVLIWREAVAALGKLYLSVLKAVIAFLYAALVVVAFYQVVSRYLLGITPAWSEEGARYLAIWVVLLTSALAIELRAHIAVDIVPNLLPRPLRLVVISFVWLCVFVFLFVFLRESFNLLAIAQGQVTPGLSIPMVYIYWILPLAGVCMLISSARAVWHFLQHDVRGLPAASNE